MKIVTWNVNGIRAALKKGFGDVVAQSGADIFCVQETKMQEGQADIAFDGYLSFWNSAERKGYSGTAVFVKQPPESAACGIAETAHDGEGRVITLDTGDFYLVNCYTPNSREALARLGYRMEWEDAFRRYLTGLDARKPVILCGDLNVAHEEIDIADPRSNRGNAGFTDEERRKMTELLSSGFTDAYRRLYPDRKGAYTWWSYMFRSREKNLGWRIDYFLVSDRLAERITDCVIRSDVPGSDHCPVELFLT